MQKNCLCPIPCKKITYEETFSMDQISFISQKTQLMHSNNNEPKQSSRKSPFISLFRIKPLSIPLTSLRILNKSLQKYNNTYTYNNTLIHLLIIKKPSHIYAMFSEMKLLLNQSESLRRMYSLNESHFRLPKFEPYYKHYNKYLSKPTLTSETINKLIHEKAKEQSKVYFNMAYGYKKTNDKHNNVDNKHQIIFDSTIKETIENYQTTMTCESNEELICNVDVFNHNDMKTFFTKNEEVTFTSNEFDIGVPQHIIYNDIDVENESILIIMNDLKNKNKSKSPLRVKNNNNCNSSNNNNNTNVITTKLVHKNNSNISSERNTKTTFITINPNHIKQKEKKYLDIRKLSTSSKIIISHNQQQYNNKKMLTLQNTLNNNNNNYIKTYKTRRLSEIVPKLSQSKETSSTCKHSSKIPTFTSIVNPRRSKSPINKQSKLIFKNNLNQYHSLQTEVKPHYNKLNYKELYYKRHKPYKK